MSTKHGFKRADRVGQLIAQELADLVTNGIKDPRVGFATITEVRMTPDLRHARVFVSTYGDDAEREQTLEGLNKAAGFLKRQIGNRLELRFVPTLTFATDTSLDQAGRINQLLDAAAKGEIEAPQAEQLEPVPVELERTKHRDEYKEQNKKRKSKRNK